MADKMESPNIAEFFSGRSVFITGATGFMGKVLLEKLLRSCPDVKNIYMLMRSKKGKTPDERLRAMLQIPLFEVLLSEQARAADKVVALTGDVMELGLGLSDEDRRTLVEEVSVVFHVAATVKFDDPIKSAIFMNVRGTREVMELASSMKNLKALLHVSTTYCNTDRVEIDEVIYPAPADWRKMITAAETLDESVLQALTPQLLGIRPNTYTFTKALGEHVVEDYKHRIPVVIFRPSIVISSLEEPMAGWMDNFNGPVGLMVAGGKGILRTVYASPANTCDYMAVDVAIKAMIIALWHRAIQPPSSEVPVYNCSTYQRKSASMQEIYELGYSLASVCPLNGCLWNPGGVISETFIAFYVRVLFLHMLPAVFVDSMLSLMKYKPMLVRLQRRIYIANIALQYFLHHEWQFKNANFLQLEEFVRPEERATWNIDFSRVKILDYIKSSFIGGRQYLLKEDMSTMPQALVHYKRMLWLDRIVKATLYLTVSWYIYKTSLIQNVYFATGDYLSALLLDS